MPDTNELARIAAMMNALRPDWPPQSLLTFLTKNHADRPYQDLAIAAARIATDPNTQTPQLLNQPGPWWNAAYEAGRHPTPTVGPGDEPRCTKPGHEYELARACRACAADTKAATP